MSTWCSNRHSEEGGGAVGEREGASGAGEKREAEVMVVDRFFLDTNGAISKKIFVVFADNKYRRT